MSASSNIDSSAPATTAPRPKPKMPKRISAPMISARKPTRAAAGETPAERIAMVTAYDAPSAKAAHRAGVDMILVGDSLAMVVLGHEDTLSLTTEEMAHHVRAVDRGLDSSEAAGCEFARPHVVGDMPWMSYHVSEAETVRNAAALMRAGANSVKLEGGVKRIPMVRAIVDAEIPVMGHIGLTPQSINALGGFKVQGKTLAAADALLADARALERAGCYAIVLEAVPDAVAKMISESIGIPTIGIGAGPSCDGQVLVWHDLLGVEDRILPKFVRRYADLGTQSSDAVAAYVADVRSGAFPSEAESYDTSPELEAALTDRHRVGTNEFDVDVEVDDESIIALYA